MVCSGKPVPVYTYTGCSGLANPCSPRGRVAVSGDACAVLLPTRRAEEYRGFEQREGGRPDGGLSAQGAATAGDCWRHTLGAMAAGLAAMI